MEDKKRGIFRKSMLDRVSSPEELNQYMRVAQPSVWVILGAIIALLAGAAVWGIFGEIDGVHPIWFILH